ncbi:Transcriptional regulatory protein DegU [Geodia barretti]|uniref:Transcriptional regulatory protein DegU n=1 Tax=Geodia barretti TaxID=519541 RepID=A0AA35XHR7_GEOBA|nr:Transcriptional regulatory protein DegU [Geodia barretti]
MLVDDHEIMRDGLREVLQRAGDFEVVGEAGDGAAAVRVAQNLNPDVIVMDVMMPLKNGIDACREITEMLPDTRVLMLTAASEEDAVMEAVAAGATGYLQKYSGKDRLLNTVRDVAQGRVPLTSRRDKTSVRWNPRDGAVESGHRSEEADRAGKGDTHALCAGAVLREDS